jgi:beta-lactamase regulating signal transducer with metallopeptidase domain
VAVVGLVTSRLFVARRVIEVCTPEEFDAVVAHEHAHARAHDNLRRLAMTATPDLLALLPAGRRLLEAWTMAAELAADERAARRTPGGLHLAAALVKVARLAVTPAPPLTASTLFEGQPITERVRRLLDPPATPTHAQDPTWLRAIAALLLLAAAVAALPVIHTASEHLLKLGL